MTILSSSATRSLVTTLFIVLVSVPSTHAQSAQVVNTVHNLSVSGPGPIKAMDEEQVCIFCHTPHEALPTAPLWNRNDPTTTFSIYPSGGSMQSMPGQPDGSSRLCLSCHDGTSAVGLVRNPNQTFAMSGVSVSGALPATSASNLGTSLADDHPVSIVPSLQDPEIALPSDGDAVQLDASGKVQCRSCHNPHDNSIGHFLVRTTESGDLCITCHPKGDWAASYHGAPTAPDFAQLITQGCGSCHDDHSAAVAARLLLASEEALCFSCHDGTKDDSLEVSGATDMVPEFQKSYIHPITLNPGVHNPGEGPIGSTPTPSSFLPEEDPNALRHVECVDCHNPHSVNPNDIIGGISGALANNWGVSENGSKVYPATQEYQVCFKCHSDSENLPSGESNKRLEFITSNGSYHPVIGPGTNSSCPSLISPWTVNSTMNCSECHSNSTTTGPAGPHGSMYEAILKLNYNTAYGVSESTTAYALCYSCHSRTTLSTRNSFRYHSRHITSGQIPCIGCHDSHGSPNTHLQNWTYSNDPDIGATSTGRLEFIDSGNGTGTCYVMCHGKDHNPRSY